MWKYNGQDEVGIKSAVDKQELFRTDDFYSLATQHSRRTIGQVTNLHKVKVVDADDIVFDDATIEEIFYFINLSWVSGMFTNRDHERLGKLLNLFREPPKPVIEPTGFGAIVEAESKFYRDETLEWQLTITKSSDKWMNKYQGFACWSELINPVVISEGVPNGLR